MNMDECSWDYFHLTDDVIIPGHKWNGKRDLLNIVLLGIPNELPEQGEEYELHRLLSTMFSVELTSNERLNILENEYGIDVKPDFRKELDTMCNLSQGVYERGLEKGVERGKLENAKAMAISLHESGVTEDLIAKAANVSVDLVRKWLGLSLT